MIKPYPSENDVRVTKPITKTIMEKRRSRNLSLLLLMLRLAMLKMGPTIPSELRTVSFPTLFRSLEKATVRPSIAAKERTAEAMKLLKATILLPGYT